MEGRPRLRFEFPIDLMAAQAIILDEMRVTPPNSVSFSILKRQLEAARFLIDASISDAAHYAHPGANG